MTAIHAHRYDNGLILLGEPMIGMESVGMTLLLPAGVAAEPAEKQGVASVLSEQVFRGAGGRSAREHSDALDRLGVQRGCGVHTHHLRLSATLIGDRLDEALPLLLDMARRPNLDEVTFGPSRDLAVQAIDALEDDPQQKVMIELKAAHLPSPIGRSSLGRRDQLEAMGADDVRAFWQDRFVADGAILAFAGKIDFDALRGRVGELLGGFDGESGSAAVEPTPPRTYHHRKAVSAQQHIGIAIDAVPETHAGAALQRSAVAVLSGGMSGRLFTEVREKRGLCYAVSAGYQSLPDRGMVVAYAGTTTERAAETLKVLSHELRRIHEGAEADEFDRAQVGLKSRIVMQGESTSARASAIATDQFLLGRPRTLDERAAEVDAVSLDALNAFLAESDNGPFTTLTIGPEPLEPNAG